MSIEREIDNDFQEIRNSSSSVTEKLSFYLENMRLVSKLPLLKVSLEYNRPEKVNEFLGSETFLQKNFSKLYVLDIKNNFFTSNEKSPEVFSLIENNKVFTQVSSALNSSNQNDIITEIDHRVYIATKIFDENDNPVGFLIGEVNESIFNDEITRLRVRIKDEQQVFIQKQDSQLPNTFCSGIAINQLRNKFCFSKKYKKSFVDKKFILILLGTSLLLALIFGLIYRILFSKILKPFYDFLQNMQSVTTGAYAEIPENSKYPEIQSLIQSSNQIVKKLKSYQNQEIEKEKSLAVSRMATQAAHDIRSPLVVLKSLEDDLRKLPEESRRRLQLGIGRIEEISFNLLQVNKDSNLDMASIQSEDLLQLVTSSFTEKTIEYRLQKRIQLRSDLNQGYGLFSSINRTSLKNIISNLINNSAESTSQNIEIKVSLWQSKSLNYIQILDNGPGISEEILEKLLKTSLTTKIKGNGIGLRNAYLEVQNWKGNLVINSTMSGTEVLISLPASQPSEFYLSSLDVSEFQKIIVIDDDPGIHEIWRSKLSDFLGKILICSNASSDLGILKDEKTLVISDYDLGEACTGFDILGTLPNGVSKILSTALSEDERIRHFCNSNQIKLIPKNTLNLLPIQLNKLTSILIDDDRLMHIHWKMKFEKNGKKLLTFYSVKEFLIEASNLDPASIIYIDSNLSDGFRGEIEAQKIYDLGFKRIFLTTGYTEFDKQHFPWITAVLGKSPPT